MKPGPGQSLPRVLTYLTCGTVIDHLGLFLDFGQNLVFLAACLGVSQDKLHQPFLVQISLIVQIRLPQYPTSGLHVVCQ